MGRLKERLSGPSGKKIILVILAILLVYVAAVVAAVLAVDQRHVRFYMTGPEQIELKYGEVYKEPGVYAVTSGKLFGDSQRRLEVKTSSDLDISRLGTYTINYTARWLFTDYSTKRQVTVVDKESPVLELQYVEGYEPTWFTGYEEEGFKATDNYDGDLSDKVQIEQLENSRIYTVTDSSGNSTTVIRDNIFAYMEPKISLFGEKEMYVTASLYFNEPGYNAVDSRGNDLTEHVRIEGEFCPYRAGTYIRSYSITNPLGETVTEYRTIHVQPVQNPDVVIPGSSTIYLTFDDGPGPYTGRLLDILDKYNVPATFFVTGADSRYFDQIGRAYREGHSIGVHTYSHNYYEIYSSEEAFFQDFNAVQDLINQQTGSYTQLSRFPGGSSNTVSSFNPGIMSRLSGALTDLGIRYFDWNVSSGDAGGTTVTSEVVDNIIAGCSSQKVSVVLQHDIKDYSVDAVEQVIVWGLNNGYSFAALDMTSPDAHHGINN